MLTVVGHFSTDGLPLPALSPTIKIWNITDAQVEISGAAMTAIGDGFYRYLFNTYDPTKTYGFIMDGGASLPNKRRFIYAGTTSYAADVTALNATPVGSVQFQ